MQPQRAHAESGGISPHSPNAAPGSPAMPLTDAEQSLYRQATNGEMKNALAHGGKGFYAVKFDEDVFLLVNQDGESIQVNPQGLNEFRSGKAISAANIGLTFAPDVSIGEIAISIAKNIPLVFLSGGGLTLTAIVNAVAAQGLSKGIGHVLNEAGIVIPAWLNPLYYLTKPADDAEANRTANTPTAHERHDPARHEKALGELPQASQQAVAATADSPAPERAENISNFRMATIVRARELGTTGAKVDIGPNNRGGDVNQSPMQGFRSVSVGTTKQAGDFKTQTSVGVATDTIQTSSAVGTSDPRKVSSGALNFGVENPDGTKLGLQLGVTNLQGAPDYTSQGSLVKNPGAKYKEATVSYSVKNGDTNTTLTPFAGFGVESIGGQHTGTNGIAGFSVNQAITDKVSIDTGYRHSIDSRGMLNVNYGNIASINLVSPSLTITPFNLMKAMSGSSEADAKATQAMVQKLQNIYRAAGSIEKALQTPEGQKEKLAEINKNLQALLDDKSLPSDVKGVILTLMSNVQNSQKPNASIRKPVILAMAAHARDLAKDDIQKLMAAAVQSNPMQYYLPRGSNIAKKMGENGQTVEAVALNIVPTLALSLDPANFEDPNNANTFSMVTWDITVSGLGAGVQVPVTIKAGDLGWVSILRNNVVIPGNMVKNGDIIQLNQDTAFTNTTTTSTTVNVGVTPIIVTNTTN